MSMLSGGGSLFFHKTNYKFRNKPPRIDIPNAVDSVKKKLKTQLSHMSMFLVYIFVALDCIRGP